MKRFLKGAVVSLACWGIAVPSARLAAAEPVQQKKTEVATADIADVRLHAGGIVAGRVVDSQGYKVASLPVVIQHEGKTVLQTKTRADGTWAAQGLRGGLHRIVVGRDQQVIRLWSPNTAPPTAKDMSTLVVSGKVVRGQDGYYYDPGYGPGPDGGFVDQGGFAPVNDVNLAGADLMGGVDIITLGSMVGSAASLVYAVDNSNKLDDLQDQIDNFPQSP